MFFTPTRPATVRRAAFVPAMHSLDRLLGQALAAPLAASNPSGAEIRADANGWNLSLDLPGVSKAQLRIDIEGPMVRIESLADAPRQYRRAYEFPQELDAAASVARLEDGVLTLTLAKKAPVDTSTRITIN